MLFFFFQDTLTQQNLLLTIAGLVICMEVGAGHDTSIGMTTGCILNRIMIFMLPIPQEPSLVSLSESPSANM